MADRAPDAGSSAREHDRAEPRAARSAMTAAVALLIAGLAGAAPAVARLEARGPVTPALSRHLVRGIERAAASRSAAVLIELDTPGGLLDSTREIVQSILAAPVPVIVHVAPSGARATSAGVFILMAADVAAMSPGSHLGAAHPVALSAPARETDEVSTLREKAVSDAAAYVRGLAAEKGRNSEWAERAVRESVSLTAAEALERRVVELVEADRRRLLERLDGRRIAKRGLRLRLAGAEVRDSPMSPALRVLQVIADPNLALLLLMIGVYGLIYEFASPGVGFGAVVGLTCLVLAGYSLSVLPVNYAGLLLIGLGVALLVVELQVPSYGLLSLGGLALLALGAVFMYDSGQTYARVSLEAVAGATAATGAFFLLVVSKLLQTRRLKPAVGPEALIGAIGEAREPLDPRGMIFVNGELWTAEAPSRLEKGERVEVVERQGCLLRVRRPKEERHE